MRMPAVCVLRRTGRETHKPAANCILTIKRRAKMKCQKCGKDTFLPFKCQYCGGYFCSEHRLPENHQCAQMDQARLPREGTPSAIVQKGKSYEYVFTYPSLKPAKSHVQFSIKEIEHLAIAALLIVGVGLSILWFQGFPFNDYVALSLFVAMFTLSFLAHEIAHKLVAQRHGLWAEFRLTLIGALLTMFSIISPLFKIIAPGAVMVGGSSDRRTIGKISIAGPATNITLATAFLAVTFLSTQYNTIFSPVAFFNAWIALFNLIPLGILDGFKIFSWDKKIWTMAFAASIVLTVVSYQHLSPY